MTNRETQEIIKGIFFEYIEQYFKEWGERVKSSIQGTIDKNMEELTPTQRDRYNWFDDTGLYRLTDTTPNHTHTGGMYNKIIHTPGELELDINTLLCRFKGDIIKAIAKAEKTARK